MPWDMVRTRIKDARNLLEKSANETGKYILKGTRTKSYLPKTGEKVGEQK